MPGPNRAPRGGYAKPKNMGRTIRRLAGYLTRSKLPLLMVLLFLVLSVGTNLAIIHDALHHQQLYLVRLHRLCRPGSGRTGPGGGLCGRLRRAYGQSA